MNEQFIENAKSITSLIDLGLAGHFPLFQENWIDHIKNISPTPLTLDEKVQVGLIFKKITQYKKLSKKKRILFNLSIKERNNFMKAFIKLVETRILNEQPEIH